MAAIKSRGHDIVEIKVVYGEKSANRLLELGYSQFGPPMYDQEDQEVVFEMVKYRSKEDEE